MNTKKTIEKIMKAAVLYFATFMPVFAFAAASDFAGLVGIVVSMVKSLIPLVVALALLYFIWGIFQLIRSNNEDTRKDATTMITFGIVALFVMVSIWGLVNILTSTVFSGGLTIPKLQ